LIGWSSVSLFGGVVSIADLCGGVISMAINGGEGPHWLVLVLVVELNSRLIWWSGVGLSGGVITISLLDLRISSVVLDGAEGPDWLFSGNKAKKASNSDGNFH